MSAYQDTTNLAENRLGVIGMEFDLSSARVEKLIIHKVGNKSRDEGFSLSKKEADFNSDIESIFLRSYLRATLKEGQLFGFWHESDLKFNEICSYFNAAILGEIGFLEASVNIAKHLYSSSIHPNISAGDLFVVSFSNLVIDGNVTTGLGVFKTESREAYFNVEELGIL